MPTPRIDRYRAALAALVLLLVPAASRADYPKLRDRSDAELQAALDEALYSKPIFRAKIKNQTAGLVVADVTDLENPRVASYNPELMMYAASLPKIGIIQGAFVEVDSGNLKIDEELHGQLVRMVKVSSNPDATAVLDKVGIERVAEILQDPKHGALYDPAYGGGLWVGKAYDKSPVWKRDPIHGITHGASAMSAAGFYYGAMTGTLIDAKHLPLMSEMFGTPELKHKFVQGLQGRDVTVYRKSGTWRNYHADSGVIVHPDGTTYIVVAIGQSTEGGKQMADLIRIVDDLMKHRAVAATGG